MLHVDRRIPTGRFRGTAPPLSAAVDVLPLPRSPDYFVVGARKTSWFVVDGDGTEKYTPQTLICRVESTPIVLPPDIARLRNEVEIREGTKNRQALAHLWNGPLYALERYVISRTIPDEHPQLTLTFRPTDYFTFQATVMSLDTKGKDPSEPTLREKYLQKHDPFEPIPFLSNGFGIALVLMTGDKKLIFGRRSNTTGARPGELDVSVVEGVHPIIDSSSSGAAPDLFQTAIRGAQEEVGITLHQSDIAFLGFGVDMQYYQWNLIGMGRVTQTARQALESRTRGTGGKWETRAFEIVDADPRTVFRFLKSEKMWSVGWVTVYWALVHEYGKDVVNAAAEKELV